MGHMMLEHDRETFERRGRDAAGYHRSALGFARMGDRHSLAFNVGSVALESYLVSLCAFHSAMPFNHNFNCLMDAAEEVVEFPSNLAREIRALDEIFGICSLDNYHHGTPEPDDATRILSLLERTSILYSESTGIEIDLSENGAG